MAQPLVSIVLLCWNRHDDVREVLGEIRGVEYRPLEVIVVDNASADGTAEMIQSEYPEVSLIRMPENLGIAGYNAGFQSAKGEYILILDDDSFPAADAVGKMVDCFAADPSLGVVAFDVRNAAARNAQMLPADGRSEASYQMSFNGAGVGIRRQLFERIGWYPAEFFLYWNEQDTSFRVLDAGYRIETFPNIISWHKSSPRNRASERGPYYYTRNAFWLVWKHYPLDMAVGATALLCYRCFYHALEQRTFVYLRALVGAFRDSAMLRGLRKPVARDIVSRARVAFEIAFSQFR